MQSLAFFSLLTFTWSHGQVFLISFRVILCFCIFFTSFFTSLSFSLIQNIFSLDIVSLHGPLEKESLIHWIRVWGLLWTQQWTLQSSSSSRSCCFKEPKEKYFYQGGDTNKNFCSRKNLFRISLSLAATVWADSCLVQFYFGLSSCQLLPGDAARISFNLKVWSVVLVAKRHSPANIALEFLLRAYHSRLDI